MKVVSSNKDTTGSQMKIKIGNAVFTATLYDNATANAFKNMLPLSINMNDLNGNEKYYYFTSILPNKPNNPGKIDSGDIMLYGDNCLVIFYASFNTSYSYTRVARINDSAGLAAAVGAGNIMVTLEL